MTDSTSASTEVHVGVDVSKAGLDVFIDPTGQSLWVDNTSAGIQSLLKTVKIWNVKLVLVFRLAAVNLSPAFRDKSGSP